MNVVDFFPRPYNNSADHDYSRNLPDDLKVGKGPLGGLKKWLIRRVQCMRGEVDVAVEVHPAFSMLLPLDVKFCIHNHRLCARSTYHGD